MTNSNRGGLSTTAVLVLLVIALIVGAAVGIFGWIWFSGGSGEPSLSVEDALATRAADDAAMASAVSTAVSDAINTTVVDAVNAAVVDAVNVAVGAAMNTVITEVVDTISAQESAEPVEFTIVAGREPGDFHAPGRPAWRAYHCGRRYQRDWRQYHGESGGSLPPRLLARFSSTPARWKPTTASATARCAAKYLSRRRMPTNSSSSSHAN